MPPPEPPLSLRLDKWLWQARFCKTRSLAARLVADGKVRVNSQRVTKPATRPSKRRSSAPAAPR